MPTAFAISTVRLAPIALAAGTEGGAATGSTGPGSAPGDRTTIVGVLESGVHAACALALVTNKLPVSSCTCVELLPAAALSLCARSISNSSRCDCNCCRDSRMRLNRVIWSVSNIALRLLSLTVFNSCTITLMRDMFSEYHGSSGGLSPQKGAQASLSCGHS